jgi:hypothetical protein
MGCDGPVLRNIDELEKRPDILPGGLVNPADFARFGADHPQLGECEERHKYCSFC